MAGSKKSVPSSANLLNFRRRTSGNTSMASSGSSNNIEDGAQTKNFKYLTTDTSLGHVLTMIVLRICRKITIDVPLKIRFLYYFCLVIFGGILSDFAPVFCRAIMPIRTSKGNILNVYFVKLGWGWTLALLSPFIIMTSSILYPGPQVASNQDGNRESRKQEKFSQVISIFQKLVTKDLTRIVVCTLVWYFSVNLFVSIESVYGSCAVQSGNSTTSQVTSKFSSKYSCSKQGYIWSGFDISGHTFLLMFSILCIIEETGIMSGWSHLEQP